MAYARLRKYLGLKEKPIRVYDPIQQMAIVDDDVLDRFEIDVIELGRGFAHDDDAWVDWVLPDGTPCQMPVWAKPQRTQEGWVFESKSGKAIGRMPLGVWQFEQSHYPFAEKADLDAIPAALAECMWTSVASSPGPVAAGPDGARRLREGAQALRAKTDRAIVGLFGGNLLEIGQFLYRNDNFFMLLAGEPQQAHAFLDRLVEIHLANLERYLAAVGDCIDVINFGDDLGMQTGPQVSPAMYREFFKPRHSVLWHRAKQLADVKVMLHSCGGIRELIPDLIEAGLDAINPVQISCRGMEAKALKADFGKDLVFWGGGCDTQTVLPRGTPEEVRRHVEQQVEILSPDGGFIFQQVHNVMANVPPENIVAMLDAIRVPA
jgi:uroporphyrinogen decarboxylase